MSEPFWKDKTLEELEGMYVRFDFPDDRTAVEGVLVKGMGRTLVLDACSFGKQIVGEAFHEENGVMVPTVNANHRMMVAKIDEYADVEMVEGFSNLREGDVFVSVDGNRYMVKSTDSERHDLVKVCFGDGYYYISSAMFAYGLRPDIGMPDESGLWEDRRGDLWLITQNLHDAIWRGERVQHHGEWVEYSGRAVCFSDIRLPEFAPFTRVEVSQ